MKVLCVDDDRTSLHVVQRMLESLGHDCITAADGSEAWRAYLTHAPDVVVSDWSMPGLSGSDLCHNIRAHGTEGYTYVIVVTSHHEPEDLVAGMGAGADDYLTKPVTLDDLRARLIAAGRVTSLHRQLGNRRTQLEDQNRQLQAVASLDPLTGLGNRRALEAELAVLEDRVMRYGHSYCMALVDIDYFKSFNDRYGHQAGDQALREVAGQLRLQARTGDSLYRYGGDELLCLFPEQSIASAGIAVERMRSGVEHLGIAHVGNPIGVLTLSAGLGRMEPDHLRRGGEVLKEADQALYQAKAGGRNRIAPLTRSFVQN